MKSSIQDTFLSPTTSSRLDAKKGDRIMQRELDHFVEQGWAVIDLIDAAVVWEAREALIGELARLIGKKIPLEEYHLHAQDDQQHSDWQFQLAEFFHAKKFTRK